MSEQQMDELVRIAADTAMRAAADYCRLNQIEVKDFDAATQILRAEVKIAIDEAIGDANKAAKCGMDKIAVTTFRASMMQAGIRAAKQFGEAA